MKNLLPIILLTTLNGQVLANNTENFTFQETSFVNDKIIENPQVEFPGQLYQYYTKTKYTLTTDETSINGITYSYMYGTPYTLSTPEIKNLNVSKDSDWAFETTDRVEWTPRQITILNIENYVKFSNVDLDINYNATNLLQNSYKTHQKIYLSTNSDINSLIDNAGWETLNFFRDTYRNVNLMLYTNLLENNTGTYSGEILLNSNSLLIKRNMYIIIFEYITTNDEHSTTAGTIATTFYQNAYPNINLSQTTIEYTWNESDNQTPMEVIDIPDLMFTILTMPFSFISQAFNLTLFAGTKYQINISALFLAIIGVMIFIMLLKIIVGAIANKG